jgi:hypothetical protein
MECDYVSNAYCYKINTDMDDQVVNPEAAAPPICPQCHLPVAPEWYFCPNCGKEINAKPAVISTWSQVGVYALSVCLPPLGLWPGIKYMAMPGRQAKVVGAIAIALTLIASVVVIWLTMQFLQSYLSVYSGLINTSGVNGL